MDFNVLQSINIPVSVSVGCGTVLFLLYWFIAHSGNLREWLQRLLSVDHITNYLPFYQKTVGIVLIGLIPALIMVLFPQHFSGEYGLLPANVSRTLLWVIFLGIPLMMIPVYSARKEKMLAYYPEVRITSWNLKLVLMNAVVWAVYLFAYEFLFRSFLLKNLMISLDVTSAIIITTAISAATHMPKGEWETFGTIPFSIVLCIAAVSTGSMWAGFIIHLALAVSNDFWAIHYNPEFSYNPPQKTYESI